VVYNNIDEAVGVANLIAPEHLEVQGLEVPEGIHNYGALFIGAPAGEVLGDYSAGPNHTLPTAGTARFSGGLSVRHFIKTPTTLRCVPGGAGYGAALDAAARIARAEGLAGHAASADARRTMN
jgi:histidinol dehydrogenase